MSFVAVCLFMTLCLNSVLAIPKYYMDDRCGSVLNLDTVGDAIRLKLTSRGSYRPNMDCTLLIKTSQYSDRFMLYFQSLNVKGTQGSCTNDWLEVHDGISGTSPTVLGLSGKLCGSYISSTVRKTSGYNLYLRFRSNSFSTWQNKGFDMVITKYHTGPCYDGEYSCSNGRCVSNDVVCNGYNPCGDYSDCPGLVIAVGAIVAIVIGSLAGIIILTVVSIVCCRRRRRRIRRGVYQPVNVVATTNYGAGYNQPVPQPYTAVPTTQYPTGQQYPPGQQNPTAPYPNQPYPK